MVPSKPTRVPPHGSDSVPSTSTSRVTGLVTPLMLRSPVTSRPLPPSSTEVAAEGHRTVVLHVEEVAGAQVRVAVLVAGVDRVQVDARGRRRRVAGDDGALELLEQPTDLAHQVAGGEADLGVARVDGPGAGRDVGLLQDVDAHAVSSEAISCFFNLRTYRNRPSLNVQQTSRYSCSHDWCQLRRRMARRTDQQHSWRAYLVGTTLLMDRLDRDLRENHRTCPSPSTRSSSGSPRPRTTGCGWRCWPTRSATPAAG